MKKQILNLGKTLNKVEQKKINGGSRCDYYIDMGLCFGPVQNCLPCDQISNYPGAIGCVRMHSDCINETPS